MRPAIDPPPQAMHIRPPATLALAHRGTIAAHAGPAARHIRQRVKMGREQRPTAVHARQILQTREADRDPILGRRAPAHLVHDDKGPARRGAQDIRRLEHLDHEGGLVAEEIIRRPDPAEELVDDAEFGVGGRHEGAGLCEDGDEGVLPEEGAFAGHVGPGEEPDALGSADEAVVAGEGAALFLQPLRDGRVAAGDDLVRGAEIQQGPYVVLFVGEDGEGTGDIELVEDGGVATEGDQVADDLLAELLEDALFFGADLESGLIDGGAEGRPFGEVEGTGRFGGADAADVGKGF